MTAPDYADLRRLLAEWDFGHSRVRPKAWVQSEWRYQCQCGETFKHFDRFEAHRYLVGAGVVGAHFNPEREALIRERDEARAKVEALREVVADALALADEAESLSGDYSVRPHELRAALADGGGTP